LAETGTTPDENQAIKLAREAATVYEIAAIEARVYAIEHPEEAAAKEAAAAAVSAAAADAAAAAGAGAGADAGADADADMAGEATAVTATEQVRVEVNSLSEESHTRAGAATGEEDDATTEADGGAAEPKGDEGGGGGAAVAERGATQARVPAAERHNGEESSEGGGCDDTAVDATATNCIDGSTGIESVAELDGDGCGFDGDRDSDECEGTKEDEVDPPTMDDILTWSFLLALRTSIKNSVRASCSCFARMLLQHVYSANLTSCCFSMSALLI
jgi:hypothetical protein